MCTDDDKKAEGVVGTSAGMTVCLGGFQSARFNSWLALPSTAENAKATFERCLNFVNEKVGGEVQKIYEGHQELSGTKSVGTD